MLSAAAPARVPLQMGVSALGGDAQSSRPNLAALIREMEAASGRAAKSGQHAIAEETPIKSQTLQQKRQQARPVRESIRATVSQITDFQTQLGQIENQLMSPNADRTRLQMTQTELQTLSALVAQEDPLATLNSGSGQSGSSSRKMSYGSHRGSCNTGRNSNGN